MAPRRKKKEGLRVIGSFATENLPEARAGFFCDFPAQLWLNARFLEKKRVVIVFALERTVGKMTRDGAMIWCEI